MANNEILQIVVFSLFFGVATAALRRAATPHVVTSIDELAHVMLKITGYVMRFAPVGVFARVAATITTQGLGILGTYGKFIGAFYLACCVLWALLIGRRVPVPRPRGVPAAGASRGAAAARILHR